MKALTKSAKLISASLAFLALAACGKSDNGTQVAAVQYGYQNGSCYDITHGTPVGANYCTSISTTTIQYQFNSSNQCILISSNAIVDPSYCQQGLYGSQYGYPYNQGSYPGYYNGGLPMGTGYAAYFGMNYYPSTYGGGAYGGTENCIGMYYQTEVSNPYSTGQLMQCGYGANCHGLFLYKQSTRVRVLCL